MTKNEEKIRIQRKINQIHYELNDLWVNAMGLTLPECYRQQKEKLIAGVMRARTAVEDLGLRHRTIDEPVEVKPS